MPVLVKALAGAYRQKDNPRWNRAYHVQILSKMHKGVSKKALRLLRQGAPVPRNCALEKNSVVPPSSPINKQLPLYRENDEITFCMKKRGEASMQKHPPVSVDYRLAGRDAIIPHAESLLDVDMFISKAGNVRHKPSNMSSGHNFIHSMDDMAREMQKLDELIHHQAAGTSTNTSIAKFRAHFMRADLFYSMASLVTSVAKDDPMLYRRPAQKNRQLKSSPFTRNRSQKKQNGQKERGTIEEYLRYALQDICIALKLEPGIAPAYFNRALYLRKLKCHIAALGDVSHALLLLSNDVGDNEMAKIKYMRLAGILEREVGLFVESGLEYKRIKTVVKEQLEAAVARRKRLAEERAREHRESMKAAGLLGGVATGKNNSKWKKSLSLGIKKISLGKGISRMGGLRHIKDISEKASTSKLSMLTVVHQATGGKHLAVVHKAKEKLLYGLLSPIAQSMAGTIPGKRSQFQIKKIMRFINSTHSDDLISLSSTTLHKVCQWIEHTSCPAGQHLFRQGDPQDAFYVLASGMATVMVISPKIHHEIPVKKLHPGDSFGKIFFPTEDEIEQLEVKSERLKEGKQREGITEERKASILSKAWATDTALGSTSSTRRAGIYANTHCEFLVLRWDYNLTKTIKSDSKESTEISEDLILREQAIREFQDHTILRRLNILKRCNVLKFMTHDDLEKLATVGSIHSWRQGGVLVSQDEIMNCVFVLFRGVCCVKKRRPNNGNSKAKPYSKTGQGEDPLDVGMLWKQQYQQHLNNRGKNLETSLKRNKLLDGVAVRSRLHEDWIQVGKITSGDIAGEMVLLNPSKPMPSPVEIVADSSVDALVFSLGELDPFLKHGVFSGRTRNLLIDSVGTNVPCEKKIECNLAAQMRWIRQKRTIVESHVWGHRHPGKQADKIAVTELPARGRKAWRGIRS